MCSCKLKIFMKTKFSILFATIAVAAFILTGCTQSSPSTNTAVPTNGTSERVEASAEINRTHLTENASFAADLKIEPSLAEAGRENTLVFTVKDKQGQVEKNLQIVHEKLMHLLIVSEDLAEFDHVHPEQQPDGTFRLNYKFANGGTYKLYTDFTPQNSPQIVNVFDVKVGGPARTRTPLVADTNLSKSVDGLTVTLKTVQPIKAAAGTSLDFYITDADGKPVTDLQPYLGAMAHFVVISEDASKFLHVHAEAGEVTTSAGTGGHEGHQDKHGEMEMDVEPDVKDTGTPTVRAHTEFPIAGIYKLWGQFQRGGKVFTVTFVLNITAADPNVAGSTEVPEDAVKITVSSNGFEPATVPVKRGEPVRLAFTRKGDGNCGSEVVFQKLNIKRALPANKTTVVELTPIESGDLAFACGMNMLKGKLVVR